MTLNVNGVKFASFNRAAFAGYKQNKTFDDASALQDSYVRFAGNSSKIEKNLLNKLQKADLKKNPDDCAQMILELSQSGNNDILKSVSKVLTSLVYFSDLQAPDAIVPAIENLSKSDDKDVLNNTASALWGVLHIKRLKEPDNIVPAILNLSTNLAPNYLSNVASALNKILNENEYDLRNPNALIPAVFNISKECDSFYMSQYVSKAFMNITSRLPKLSHEAVRSESFQKLIPTLIEVAKNINLSKPTGDFTKDIKAGLSSLHSVLTKGSKEKEEVTNLRKAVAQRELEIAQQSYNHEIELINNEHNR